MISQRTDAWHMVMAFIVGVLCIMVPIIIADIHEIRANRRRHWRRRNDW